MPSVFDEVGCERARTREIGEKRLAAAPREDALAALTPRVDALAVPA